MLRKRGMVEHGIKVDNLTAQKVIVGSTTFLRIKTLLSKDTKF